MFWIAVIYAVSSTLIIFKIGRPLVKLNYQQQMYEADFRYNLVRVRESAENIASYKGDEIEKKIVTKNFDNIFSNFMQIVNRMIKINVFSFFYSSISDIVPIAIAGVKYFAKEITLGAMSQTITAFGEVRSAMSYFIFAYSEIANWRAVMDRLLGFRQAIVDADQLPEIVIIADDKNYLRLENLEVKLPNGEILISHLSQTLNNGDRLLITGASGSGKTTLIRVLNQLWPFATGKIFQKPGLDSLFISQRPYLPKTNLKESICYPKLTDLPSDEEVKQILVKCQLPDLVGRLYDICDWSVELSLGEQQKISFGRVLINKPDIIYLDEITSALDLESEEKLYQEIIDSLPNSLIISVGHRLSLSKFHNKTLEI
jgi:putative ATP-binding cassette transporter